MSTTTPISPLRRRMIEDMTVRGFGEKTQSDYIRHVKNFSTFLGRSPDTAEGKDLRAFQVRQREQSVQPPTMNGAVAALRFFFTTTCDRPEMARHLSCSSAAGCRYSRKRKNDLIAARRTLRVTAAFLRLSSRCSRKALTSPASICSSVSADGLTLRQSAANTNNSWKLEA